MAHRIVFVVSIVALLASSLACCCLPVSPPGLPTQQAPTSPSTTQPTSQPAIQPIPRVVDTWTRPADGMVMVYVPAGEFQMGSEDGSSEEQPAHTVALDGFWIDQTEVTNGQYARCVAAGACEPPTNNASNTRSSYYDDPAYADYPVIWVSWDQAATYADWVGGRLPTEAEWEYAARGPEGSVYPWGNQAPSCTLANADLCEDDTSSVGSYPAGASWVGALDMAGNVWEWVADWYGPYPAGPQENPTGPTSGENRVVRGGTVDSGAERVRAAHRWGFPYYAWGFVGFRVAMVSPASP